jgi:hypothetical protein
VALIAQTRTLFSSRAPGARPTWSEHARLEPPRHVMGETKIGEGAFVRSKSKVKNAALAAFPGFEVSLVKRAP